MSSVEDSHTVPFLTGARSTAFGVTEGSSEPTKAHLVAEQRVASGRG